MSGSPLWDGLDKDAVLSLARLRRLANEYHTICQQAPAIWDGETNDDVRVAKRGCNGQRKGAGQSEIPPCPIRNLCLQTAMKIGASHGVWGGLAPHERRALRRNSR